MYGWPAQGASQPWWRPLPSVRPDWCGWFDVSKITPLRTDPPPLRTARPERPPRPPPDPSLSTITLNSADRSTSPTNDAGAPGALRCPTRPLRLAATDTHTTPAARSLHSTSRPTRFDGWAAPHLRPPPSICAWSVPAQRRRATGREHAALLSGEARPPQRSQAAAMRGQR